MIYAFILVRMSSHITEKDSYIIFPFARENCVTKFY